MELAVSQAVVHVRSVVPTGDKIDDMESTDCTQSGSIFLEMLSVDSHDRRVRQQNTWVSD